MKKIALFLEPLTCALSFSSYIERKALNGPWAENELLSTVKAVASLSSLAEAASDGTTALEQAICFNDVAVVNALLTVDPNLATLRLINQQKSNLYTYPVHLAAQVASHRDSVDTLDILKLLRDGSSHCVLQCDSEGRTPLHLAAEGISIRPAAWLLQIRPKLLNVVDQHGKTALYYCNTMECAELLLTSGADINHRAHGDQAALHYFAETVAGHMFYALCKHGADMDLLDHSQRTPMYIATMTGCREAVVALAAAGASVNISDKSGIAPLHIAIRNQRNDLTEILLNHGAELWSKSFHGTNALHLAITTDNLLACKLLLKSPGNCWVSDGEGNTPLHYCAEYGSTQILKYLTRVYN
jgi:ankyrin repeat protein